MRDWKIREGTGRELFQSMYFSRGFLDGLKEITARSLSPDLHSKKGLGKPEIRDNFLSATLDGSSTLDHFSI
jgi:hypothetical protein